MKTLSFVIIGLVAIAPVIEAKKTQSERTGANSPEEQLATFTLPEGFVIELVASEADGVVNPIDMAFDDAGRLWTQTGRMYPLDPVKDIKWNELLRLMDNPEEQEKNPEFKRVRDLYQGKTKGEDQVLVLSGLYGGEKTKTSVFADGLTIPQSVLPYKSGVIVAQGSELFFLDDTDGDGKADKREPILTGFGYTDTHTMTHTMVRGPGGWVHFSQGALNKGEVTAVKSGAKANFDFSKIGRFSLDGNKVEVISAGLNNIWGFWMRSNGQWWGTEANDKGHSITPMEPGTAYAGIGNEKIRSYQPFLPPPHKFRVGGTGISGLAYADDESGSFPAGWKDVAFLANPITNTINAVRIVRNADGTVSAEHLPDFLSCTDDWFRPVNMEFGPDGCLYVADWYNKIVSHNELPTTHPDRDKSHGRIWRIRHKDQVVRKVPDLYLAEPAQLLEHLSAPSIWEKRAAVHQIGDRGLKQLAAPLLKLISDESATEITRIHALWALEALGHYDAGLMGSLLKSNLADLRRESARAFGYLAPDLATLNKGFAPLVNDPNPMVRSAVLRAIAERGEADAGTIDILVSACKAELPGNQMGGPYERKFERFLARMALEQFSSQLGSYLTSEAAGMQPSGNLLWASQALPEAQRNDAFLKIWASKSKGGKIDESTFIAIAGMLGSSEISKAVSPTLQSPENGVGYVAMALENQAQVQSPELAMILSPVVEKMLGNDETRKQGLDAIARLKVPVASGTILKLLEESPTPELLTRVLAALQASPKENRAVFASLTQNEALPFDLRLNALDSLIKVAPAEGQNALEGWISKLSEAEKKQVVTKLSASKQGAGLLMHFHESGQLTTSAFDLASAERTHKANTKDPRGRKILDELKKTEAEKKSEFASRLKHLMAVPDRLEGDPAKGEVLFGICLLCHKVGDQGFDIAPALDGSAHRELEALLTAILDPDVAVEGGYLTFRVKKKDGSSLEGYLSKEDARGVTLAFMGGSTVFIPTDEIQSKQFIGGRSFMPKGLIDAYDDQQVADLLAFINTLK